jgi:hypothetical protein
MSGSSVLNDASLDAWILANKDPLRELPRDVWEESSNGVDDMVLFVSSIMRTLTGGAGCVWVC